MLTGMAMSVIICNASSNALLKAPMMVIGWMDRSRNGRAEARTSPAILKDM